MFKLKPGTPKGIKFIVYYLIIGLLIESFRQIIVTSNHPFLLAYYTILAILLTWFFIWGILKAKNWMRIVLLIAIILGIPLSIVIFIGSQQSSLWTSQIWFKAYMIFYLVLDIILSSISIWFLGFNKVIKRYFNEGKKKKIREEEKKKPEEVKIPPFGANLISYWYYLNLVWIFIDAISDFLPSVKEIYNQTLFNQFSTIFGLLFLISGLLLIYFIVTKLLKGKNWARIAIIIFSIVIVIINLPFIFKNLTSPSFNLFKNIAIVIITIIIGVYLIFNKQVNEFFGSIRLTRRRLLYIFVILLISALVGYYSYLMQKEYGPIPTGIYLNEGDTYGNINITENVTFNEPFQTFYSKQGRFSILIPNNPSVNISEQYSLLAGFVFNYAFTSKYENITYVVSYLDLPRWIMKSYNHSEILDSTLNKSMKDFRDRNLTSEIAYNKSISLDGYPGIDYAMRFNNKTLIRASTYLVDNRIYHVIALASNEKLFTNNITKFLNSFTVVLNGKNFTRNQSSHFDNSLEEITDLSEEEIIENFQVYTSKDGNYSIIMPQIPKLDFTLRYSSQGQVLSYWSKARGKYALYYVYYWDYPNPFYEHEENGIVEWEAHYEQEVSTGFVIPFGYKGVTINDDVGREMIFEFPGEKEEEIIMLEMRLYLIGKRFYNLGVFYYKSDEPREKIDKFFNSFTLLKEENER